MSGKTEFSEQSVLHARPSVILPDGEDSVVLVPEEPTWARVNEAGMRLLRRCRHGVTASDIVGNNDDAPRFLARMVELRLLTTEPIKNIPYTGKRLSEKPGALARVALHLDPEVDPVAAMALSAVEQAAELGCAEVTLSFDGSVSTGAQRALVNSVLTRGMKLRVVMAQATLNDEVAGALGDDDSVVIVSVDGHTDSLNDSLRSQGSLARALANLDKAASKGLKTEVITHICEDNVDSLGEIRQLVGKRNISRHSISWQKIEGGYSHGHRTPVSAGAVAEIFKRLQTDSMPPGVGDEVRRLRKRLVFGAGVKLDLCDGAWGSLAVGKDGGLYPCSWCAKTNNISLGSLRDNSLEDIWTNSIDAALVRQNSVQRSPKCYLCSAKYLCGGFVNCLVGCAHLAEQPQSLSRDVDSFCGTFRALSEESLRYVSSKMARSTPASDAPTVLSSMRLRAERRREDDSLVSSTGPICTFPATMG